MPNFNKVLLMGNLTGDPELRYIPNGTAVANLGIAVNRVWNTPEGEQKKETCFVDCLAFGKAAETLSQYCKKGNPLFIEGRLRFNQWETDDGRKLSKLNVIVERFQFIGAGKKSKREVEEGSRQEPSPNVDDSEIPF